MIRTIQGDTFDLIAWRELGSVKHTVALMDLNREHLETQVFEAGIELKEPTVESGLKEVKAPWQ